MNMQNIKKLLTPYDNDYVKKRFGKHYDGGYILYPELLEHTECIYSFGISHDISFETDILEQKKLNIYMYDGTVEHVFSEPNFKFTKHNVSSEYFLTELHKNEHLDCEDILLKCDIEGAEFELFNNLPDKVIKIFSQICLEVHYISKNLEQSHKLFSRLNENFTLFHIHGNNWAPINSEGIPEVLELSYVRNDFVKNKTQMREKLPHPDLDSANKINTPDYEINWWLQNK